jgi:hypothetical protein
MADSRYDIEFGANTAAFDAGVGRTVSAINGPLTGAFSGLASKMGHWFGMAALIAYSKQVIAMAGDIVHSSERLGITTEAFQRQKFVLEENGASIGDLEQAYRSLAMSMTAAAAGGDKQLAAFNFLGITPGERETLNRQQMFARIAEGFERVGNSARSVNALVVVLGRSAQHLAPAFQEGFAGAVGGAKAASQVINSSVLHSLHNLEKEAKQEMGAMKRFSANILAGLYAVWSHAAVGPRALAGEGMNSLMLQPLLPGGAPTGSVAESVLTDYLRKWWYPDTEVNRKSKGGVQDLDDLLKPHALKAASYPRPSSDALTRIGLFMDTGPGSQGAFRTSVKRHLERIEAKLTAIQSNTH